MGGGEKGTRAVAQSFHLRAFVIYIPNCAVTRGVNGPPRCDQKDPRLISHKSEVVANGYPLADYCGLVFVVVTIEWHFLRSLFRQYRQPNINAQLQRSKIMTDFIFESSVQKFLAMLIKVETNTA